MIKLTRIDDSPIIMNETYIESIIESADTIVTLINGKSYVVKENVDDIMKKICDFKKLSKLSK